MSKVLVDTTDLVTLLQYADELGVTASATHNWAYRHGDFPEPVIEVPISGRRSVRLFSRKELEKWRDSTGH